MAHDQPSIKMCVGGISASLLAFTKARGKSAELRHQLAVVLSHSTPESAFQPTKAASSPGYLYWPFSGVTLGEQWMVAPSG